MPNRAAILLRTAALAGLFALGACSGGDGNNIADLDNSLTGNGADPALTSALEDQILVDPNLVQQAHPNQARPPETPVQAQYPADGGGTPPAAGAPAPAAGAPAAGAAPAGQAAAGAAPAGTAPQGQSRVRQVAAATSGASPTAVATACGVPLSYGNEWAGRMPAEFTAYPGGHLSEAAGNDRGQCRIRVISFTTSDPAQHVVDYYRGLAGRAGYSAEQQRRGGDQILGGTHGDAAYYLIVTPMRGGSDVALIVNNGR